MAIDESTRAATRAWLANWQAADAVLEAERVRDLESLDDDQAWAEVEALAALWEPNWPGDDGAALLLHQDLFARSRRASR